ncbi:class I SAM-dependent methyltransferase [Bacillus sp. P14.5]|uniref:class I SAM-dependent methyltransferase n=1 Tax=Bacillus sp. P14.5 TaxID=1983400 RepID=UPI000DEB3FEB|nr:class I SAM-dependent methyltransferase [Bacillus sp. P14.5]
MGNYLDFLALYGIGGAHPGGILLTKELLYRETISDSMSVLDIGCGTGQTAAFIKEMFGSRVVGLENHPVMLEKARKRMQAEGFNVELIEGSAESMPFDDQEFDFIISESVLSFVDKKAVLSEAHRVLKSGGVLIAVEMTAEGEIANENKDEVNNFYGVQYLLKEEEWRKCTEEAGFSMVEIESPDFPLLSPEPVIEFNLSEVIPEEIHEMLDRHEEYLAKYKDLLGVRIIRCIK